MRTRLYAFMAFILVSLLSVSCGLTPIGEVVKKTETNAIQAETAFTTTPTVLGLAANVVTETPVPPLPAGYFELHVRTIVQEQQECIVIYPFTTRIEEGRMLLQAEDMVELDCRFVGEFCGEDGCINIHLKYLMDTRVDGEILEVMSEPSPSLHAFYFYDGEMSVFYSGFPPEAINPFPEENPMSVPLSDIATLVLPFADGASVTFPVGISIDQMVDIEQPVWELVLRLE